MINHDYEKFAANYAQFKPEGTLYLLFNDIEKMLRKYGQGNRALDYGCGTGDGIVTLKKMGYETVGVDISREMLNHARGRDPEGAYHLIESAQLPNRYQDYFDVAIVTTVLTEISTKHEMVPILQAIYGALKTRGVVIISNCTADCYQNNWLSFQCDFPENQHLVSGQSAKMFFPREDFAIYDYFWTDQDYVEVFDQTPFTLKEQLLSVVDEADHDRFAWQTELTKSAWSTFVLQK